MAVAVLVRKLSAVVLAVCCLDAAGPKRPPQRLLEVRADRYDVYHHDEVWARNGDQWLGLVRENGDWRWERVTLQLKRVPDPLDTPAPGWKVQVQPAQPRPLLLVGGLNELAGKPVATSYFREKRPWLGDKPTQRILRLGELEYRLIQINPHPEKHGGLGPGAALILRHGATVQTLYDLPNGGSDASWSLHWAGDCDGDGRLDLYVTVTSHYNVSERRLYMSSRAKKGELVGLYADLVTGGC